MSKYYPTYFVIRHTEPQIDLLGKNISDCDHSLIVTFNVSTEICAGTPDGSPRRQGTCKGDSGGPLHVKENRRWTDKF